MTTKLSKWSQQSKTETGKHLSLHRNQFNSSIACAKAKSGKNSRVSLEKLFNLPRDNFHYLG